MKEQAEKLTIREQAGQLAHTLLGPTSTLKAVAAIQLALEAAREEGRRLMHPGDYCHDPRFCPDCAKLCEQGAEELRVKVVKQIQEYIEDNRDCGAGSPAEAVFAAMRRLLTFPSLAPPKPKVPEWFSKWWEAHGFATKSHPHAEFSKQKAWEDYLAHAPKLDAERLAEATRDGDMYRLAVTCDNCGFSGTTKVARGKTIRNAYCPICDCSGVLTAAIRAAMENAR